MFEPRLASPYTFLDLRLIDEPDFTMLAFESVVAFRMEFVIRNANFKKVD